MTEPQPRTGWSDEQVEKVIGNLLRAGVLLAALVVLAGGFLYLVRDSGKHPPDLSRFDPGDEYKRSPVVIVRDLNRLDSLTLMQFGLLLLILTPITRVLFSVVAFAGQRDATYVILTLIVLGILLYSLFAGRLG